MDTNFNRLKDENSSYLKQHAQNPVNWWSYGPEALEEAKAEDKPIFLSIGYSSCHWCHVMNAESFNDQETADFLNENFICIKVDKEEYPDLDAYYQQACSLYTKGGGWPLSAFLLPDTRPYFVGTYYPKTSKQEGQASFMDLLKELSRAYKDDQKQVLENVKSVCSAIEDGLHNKDKVDFPGHFPPPASIMDVLKEFQDDENGGYGSAPKFPQFSFLEWAVEQMLEGMIPKEQGEHIIKTIEKMLMGGLLDHAKGGVHRYSIDEKWTVPHFEKMLYDQAGLLSVLSKVSIIFPSPLVFDTIMGTLDYLESEMMSEDGYFFSSQDSDSEGSEGLFFTFTEEEFEDVINDAQEDEELENKMDQLKDWFNISKKGNFKNGLNVISLNYEKRKEIFTQDGWQIIRKIRKAIVDERKNRIPPATDNKGVASWNFLAISSLLDVIQYCQIPVIKEMASRIFNKALEGSYKKFLTKNNESAMELIHCTTRSRNIPYLEDYVFFCHMQLRVFEVTGNELFKDNFKQTLDFILKEFVIEDKVLTRPAQATDLELYPNLKVAPFDTNFKSASSVLLGVIRRGRALLKDSELGSELEKFQENSTHEVLKNPLSAGEALRSLIYPDEAYRSVQAPHTWPGETEFVDFISYFLPRFVLNYHTEKNDTWQICNMNSCELQGEGLNELIATLRPNNTEEEK